MGRAERLKKDWDGSTSRSFSDGLDDTDKPGIMTTSGLSIIPLLVGIGCFMNSYDGDFLFDDTEAVVNNKDVTTDVSWTVLFKHDFWGGKLVSNTSHKSYRPLTVLTYRWNHWLAGGLYPMGFHVVNIILHGLVCFLLYHILTLVFTSTSPRHAPKMAFTASLLFAAHPVHTESVAAVVGRADLLCALCFLLSFFFYTKCCTKGLDGSSLCWLLLSVLVGAVSVLFKEQGLTVLGICSVYDVILVNKINPRHVLRYFQMVGSSRERRSLLVRQLVLMAAGILILITRWRVMGGAPPVFQVVDNPHSFVNNTLLRVLNYNYLYSINCWLLLNPWWLCFDWSMGCVPVITSFADTRLLVVCIFLVAMATLIHHCLSDAESADRRLLMMCLAFLIIPFLPASNLFFRVGFVIAERNLYLPSIGFVSVVALGLHSIESANKYNKTISHLFWVVLVIFIARSIHRSHQWRKEELLFESGALVCPYNAKVHYNIGKIHGDKGHIDHAVKKYRIALRLHPEYDQAMNNLANILKDREENQEAEELLEKAVKINPRFAAAWMNLGIVQSSVGKEERAEQSYFQALRHRRNYPDCYYNLGNLYLSLKRHVEALNAWRNATLQRQSHVNAWTNILILLDDLGRPSDVEHMAKEALQVLPQEPSIHYNLANSLGKAGQYEKSEQHFLKAIQYAPKNAVYFSNLAVLYHRWGKYERAEKYYKKALELNPDAPQTRENLQMLYKKLGRST